jgi:hypothetical protein
VRLHGAAGDEERKRRGSPTSALENGPNGSVAMVVWDWVDKHERVGCGLGRDIQISTREWGFGFFVWGPLLGSRVRTQSHARTPYMKYFR